MAKKRAIEEKRLATELQDLGDEDITGGAVSRLSRIIAR
jgi:hypothetical protein